MSNPENRPTGHPTSPRLRALTPDDLGADQKAVYEGIAGGDRAKGVQHFPLVAADGSLNGPFGVMLHAPGVGQSLQELGATIRYRTSLSPRVREIAILLVAQALGSEFEWWAHERVGRAVGLTDAELDALSRGEFSSSATAEQATYEETDEQAVAEQAVAEHAVAEQAATEQAVERAAADLCVDLLRGGRVDQSRYDSYVAALGVAAMIELSTLVGYYRTLADLMRLFDIGVPADGSEP